MNRVLCTLSGLSVVFLSLGGCSKLALDGESSPRNTKVISVSVPADPIPPAVKPLPAAAPGPVPEKKLPRRIPRQVDQNLLPQDLPPENTLGIIPLEPSRPPGSHAFADDQSSLASSSGDTASVVYDGTVITEDVTWRGAVLVKGFVVVAPQATLRVDPGTVIRFAGPGYKNGAARLVVQGRLHASGTATSPILMTSARSKAARGDWGGISLVSSEKRNILEHCRIEYADSGIDARFSTLSLKSVVIIRSHTAILVHDTVLQINGGSVGESETGIEAHDSELDVRDTTIANCQRGLVMNRTSVGLATVKIRGNEQSGLLAEDCRVKISSAVLTENGNGARFKGGEGQIQMTRFIRNRETALHLSGARIKVQRCQFADNSRDAIRLEDGRALVTGNAFNANKGFNLYNAGREDASALLNWWGGIDQSLISQKIYDAVNDPRSGSVQVFPWLTEKPAFIP